MRRRFWCCWFAVFVIDKVGRKTWMAACFVIGGLLLAPLGLFGADDVNR